VERPVEGVAIARRVQAVVELDIAVVPPEVLVLVPRLLSGAHVGAHAARILLLTGADREVAVVGWIVGAVSARPAVEAVGQGPHRGAIAATRSRERLGESPPERLAVQRRDRAGAQVVAVERAGAHRQRRLVELVDELVVGVPRVTAAEAAARRLIDGAGLHEAAEGALEAAALSAEVT
jgi:hypothetical protein